MPKKRIGLNVRYKGDVPPVYKDFKQLLEIVKDADNHYDEGIYYLGIPDFFARRDPKRLHSFPYMAAIATVTQNVKFGPNVLEAPLFHPKHIADMSSSIDIMSNGRFILGVGLGVYEPGYKNFGVSWHDRGKILDEQLEVITKLWTEAPANYKGKFFQIENEYSPPNIQKPHLPIWVGGGSEAAMRRSAQYGGEWAPSWWFVGLAEQENLEVLDKVVTSKTSVGVETGFNWKTALETYKKYCTKYGKELVLGRPPQGPKEVGFNISGFNFNINPDKEKALEEAKYFWVDVRKSRTQGGGSFATKSKYAAIGKPSDVIEKISEAYKIGANCVTLYPLSTNLKAQWERLKELLPSL